MVRPVVPQRGHLPVRNSQQCERRPSGPPRRARRPYRRLPRTDFITPFALLVSLLTSYRVNNAHHKWERANATAMELHEVTRTFICRMCSTFENTPSNVTRIHTSRRLMVLGCVSTQKLLQGERKWDDEINIGLVTPEEATHSPTYDWEILIWP